MSTWTAIRSFFGWPKQAPLRPNQHDTGWPPIPIKLPPAPPPPAPPPAMRDAEVLMGTKTLKAEHVEAYRKVEDLARLVAARVLYVYRLEYIEESLRLEPDSLLALVSKLQAALSELHAHNHGHDN